MKLAEEMNKIMEDHMREVFDLPDWVYRDIPWIKFEDYMKLIEVIGEDNIKIISGSRRQGIIHGVEDDRIRQSVLISPEGMKNLENIAP